MLKQCKVCDEWKDYDPDAKKDSKASGFYGRVCWTCFVEAQRETNLERSRKYRATPEGREASRKASRKRNRKLVTDTVTGETITYGALKSRKQIANGNKAEYYRNRRAEDPLFKLRKNIASLIINSMKGKGFSKSTKSAKLLGCSYEVLLAHLQSTLPDWQEHEVLHIDHRLPCAYATDAIEMVALQHYTNLQWLPGRENLSKSNSLPDNHEDELQALLDLLWHREGSGEIQLQEYL